MFKIIDFHSKHFELFQLADDIYTAIASDGGHAICNSGVINLGGQILIFDTFVTPHAAADLQSFILNRYGRSPQLVVDSHYHNDHIWGNQVFAPEGLIISSAKTYQFISTEGLEEYKWNVANAALRLEAMQAQYQEANENQRKQLILLMGEYQGIVEALPHLSVTKPNITFDSRLEVYGTQYTAELLSLQGHTGSDTVLHLPQAGIVFMGDLLFVGYHPYLGDGNPIKLIESLKEMIQLDAAYYVPGHGPVGTMAEMRLLVEYVEDCIDTAQGLVKSGDVSKEQIDKLSIPEPYKTWGIPQFYTTNISFLCERYS